MAGNLMELLELDGYSCKVFRDIGDIKTSFNESCPRAIVLDELNNKGGYGEVLQILANSNNHPKIIILCSDSGRGDYPLADSCLGLPASIDRVAHVLSKWEL